jgi:hypothetical protein
METENDLRMRSHRSISVLSLVQQSLSVQNPVIFVDNNGLIHT